MTSSFDSAVIGLSQIEDIRLLRLARGVRLVHLEAIVWCKARRTDGEIIEAYLQRLTDEPDPLAAATQLVTAGLWERTDEGWRIVDYDKQQMTKARVEKREERAKQARADYESRHPDRKRSSRDPSRDRDGEASRESSRDRAASQPASLPANSKAGKAVRAAGARAAAPEGQRSRSGDKYEWALGPRRCPVCGLGIMTMDRVIDVRPGVPAHPGCVERSAVLA
jgi:hypothetical protein